MKIKLTNSLVNKDVKMILKSSWSHFLWIWLLMWFLMFLLNVFLGLSVYTQKFSDEMKDKLGMYFYIKDVTGKESEIYKEVIKIKDELETKWLRVMFSSKDDAIASLQKKIPNVVDTFQKYGIDNPLPATLYVMFDSDDEYQVLKTIIIEHKDLILNIKDISQWYTIKQQENRVLTAINLSNFVVNISYTIVMLLWIVILSFLIFLMKDVFYKFYKDLEIRKLLGASYIQVMQTFVILSLLIILFSFVVGIVLFWLWVVTLNLYIGQLLNISIFGISSGLYKILLAIAIELIVLTVTSWLTSYSFIKSLHKKI